MAKDERIYCILTLLMWFLTFPPKTFPKGPLAPLKSQTGVSDSDSDTSLAGGEWDSVGGKCQRIKSIPCSSNGTSYGHLGGFRFMESLWIGIGMGRIVSPKIHRNPKPQDLRKYLRL